MDITYCLLVLQDCLNYFQSLIIYRNNIQCCGQCEMWEDWLVFNTQCLFCSVHIHSQVTPWTSWWRVATPWLTLSARTNLILKLRRRVRWGDCWEDERERCLTGCLFSYLETARHTTKAVQSHSSNTSVETPAWHQISYHRTRDKTLHWKTTIFYMFFFNFECLTM